MAKTDERLFAPFPIEMDEHPKIAPLGDAAFRALFEATFYSRRMLSDGFLDERIVLKRWGQAVADELASNDPNRPSWIRVEGGWQIHDFEKHHPLRADIDSKRESRRESGRIGGLRSGETRRAKRDESNIEANTKQTRSKTNPESETESETKLKTPAPAVLTSEFDTAWSYWPKKVDRKDALAKFKIAARQFVGRESELVDAIRAHGEAHAAYTAKQFVPGLAVWLNKERWGNPLPVPDGSKQQDVLAHNLRLYEQLAEDEKKAVSS